MIDAEQELPYSSKFEVELRAATVTAVEMILNVIKEKGSALLKTYVQRSYEVDWLLW